MSTPKPKLEPRFEEKIATAAPFAQPILQHFRKLVHQGCPDVEEAIKWNMPFYLRKGRNMCHMAAFKKHCIIGFWHPEMNKAIAREGLGGKENDAAGLLGRITSKADLPSDAVLLRLIKGAAALNESGKVARPRLPDQPKRPEAEVPADLKALLAKERTAAATFEKFSPTHRREYVEWITEAKREETRAKRLTTTIEWLTEGKPRHWQSMTAARTK